MPLRQTTNRLRTGRRDRCCALSRNALRQFEGNWMCAIHPADRPTGQRASRDFCSGTHGASGRETAPPPCFSSHDQIREQGVSFQVPTYRQQVIVVLVRKRLKTSLISVPQTRRPAMSRPALSLRSRQPTDKLRKRTIHFRPDDEMPVAPHHTKGQQPDSRAGDRFLKDSLKRLKIIREKKIGVRAFV